MTELVQLKQTFDQTPIEDVFQDPSKRYTILRVLKGLSAAGIFFGFVQIGLGIMCNSYAALALVPLLIFAGTLFLAAAAYIYYWANKKTELYQSGNDLSQPSGDETETRIIHVVTMVLFLIAAAILINLYAQYGYPDDYVTAISETNYWISKHPESKPDDVIDLLETSFILFSIIGFFYAAYFLFSARVTYKFLAFEDDYAISNLIFLSCNFVFGLGLLLVLRSNHATFYDNYTYLHNLFPIAIVKGMYVLGIIAPIAAFIGFIAGHKRWRSVFWVISGVFTVYIVLLLTYTGLSYRYTRDVDEFYTHKGCKDGLAHVHKYEIESIGCPFKYLPDNTACDKDELVINWEDKHGGYECLNLQCCGLLGQLYSKEYLDMSNLGLLTFFSACMVTFGCYYYLTKASYSARKSRIEGRYDYAWLILMFFILVGFMIVYFNFDKHHIEESAVIS